MEPAIVGSLIGACAVVIGVYLAQGLSTRRREAQDRHALSQSLNAATNELFAQMSRTSDPKEWIGETIRINRLLDDMAVSCVHMGRKRRKETYALLDECRVIVINSSGRAGAAGGVLPHEEQLSLGQWLAFASLAVGNERPISNSFGEGMMFYGANGLNARRPGAPPLAVPPRNFVQRMRRKRVYRNNQAATNTSGGGVSPTATN